MIFYPTMPDIDPKHLLEQSPDGEVVAIVGYGLEIMRLSCQWVDAGWRCFEHMIIADGDDHMNMVIFFKTKITYFDKEPLKIAAKHAGKIWASSTFRQTDGSLKRLDHPVEQSAMKCRGTIWRTDDVEGDLRKCFDDKSTPRSL